MKSRGCVVDGLTTCFYTDDFKANVSPFPSLERVATPNDETVTIDQHPRHTWFVDRGLLSRSPRGESDSRGRFPAVGCVSSWPYRDGQVVISRQCYSWLLLTRLAWCLASRTGFRLSLIRFRDWTVIRLSRVDLKCTLELKTNSVT